MTEAPVYAERHRPLSRGLWGILATPFLPDLRLDESSLRRQVRLFTGLRSAGLVALGVFGEGAALNSSEQRRVVEVITDEADDLRVVVGISSRATAVAAEQAQDLAPVAGDKLEALMVQINSPVADVVIAHLHAVHAAAGGAGIVLQDYPAASGIKMTPAAVGEVLAACPFIVAVKAESSPSPVAVAEVVASTTVPVFGGLGGINLLDELAAGASGAMTGFSHPEALIEAIEAFDSGGFEPSREAFSRWLALVNFEAQAGFGLAIRKEILRERGVIDYGTVRPPSPAMPDSLRPLLKQHLRTAGGAS